MTKNKIKTKQLYKEDCYCTAVNTKLVDILIHSNGEKLLVLESTPFFPEGGGQPSDLGLIGNLPIDYVYEDDGIVYHRVASSYEETIPFSKGDELSCSIDWNFRFENMQRHCAEHILSGVFHREFSGSNKGFHMGKDYMTIDIAFDEVSQNKEDLFSLKTALAAEQMANEIIWQDLPVEKRFFDSKEDADNHPHRKDLTLLNDISLVCIGDWNDPSDLVACCGTHPSSTGQVGLLKVYKVEKNKGMLRIYFDGGRKAMDELDMAYDMAKDLADKHSTSIDELSSRLEKDARRYEDLKEENKRLREHISSRIASELTTAMKRKKEKHGTSFVNLMARGADIDDFVRAMKSMENDIEGTLVVSFPNEKTLLMTSDGNMDCGALIKKYEKEFKAKGGGNKKSARAIFDSNADLVAFIDAIKPE